jgi:hypothetical protein
LHIYSTPVPLHKLSNTLAYSIQLISLLSAEAQGSFITKNSKYQGKKEKFYDFHAAKLQTMIMEDR